MANFNEKINCGTWHVLSVRDYSIQNGYYSNELDIWYDGKEVIHGIICPVAS